MRGLNGKNVLVTGGASGIGQATAARFLEEDCAVCVIDSSADARTRVAGELPDLTAVIGTPSGVPISRRSDRAPDRSCHHLTALSAIDRGICASGSSAVAWSSTTDTRA